MSSAEIKTKFEKEAIYPLIDEIVEVMAATGISENAVVRFKECLIYNTIGGKYNRGISVVDSYKILKQRDLTETEYKQACVLGFGVELLQAFFLVSDDIMDSSKTRRGQPCWYLVPGVNMIAINDAFLLESGIYILLKKYFRKESYYVDLLELFHEVTFQTECGQTIDLITAPEDDVDLNRFSLEKYYFIVRYKTAFYSFYLPVALAMHMAGIANEKDLEQARSILIPLGEYFQVQDDFIDCFGDPEITGKIGTDIQDNKCGWIINMALKKCSAEQRKVLDENYGKKNSENEARVRKVFDDLEIAKDFHEYEETVAKELRAKIAKVDESRGFKGEVLEVFLNKIYKRQK